MTQAQAKPTITIDTGKPKKTGKNYKKRAHGTLVNQYMQEARLDDQN